MKKLVLVAILVALVGVVALPFVVSAATTVNIAITATGSEVSLTCNQTAWAVGIVHLADTIYTSDNLTWGEFTNGGSEAMDIVCHAHDMTGGAVTWTLHNTTPGAATFAMMGSIASENDTEIHTSDYAFVTDLAASGTQTFGLVFKAPTSGLGNEAMTMTSDNVLFTGSIHV
jgi:hypothetical protein